MDRLQPGAELNIFITINNYSVPKYMTIAVSLYSFELLFVIISLCDTFCISFVILFIHLSAIEKLKPLHHQRTDEFLDMDYIYNVKY
jgi:hypothetical protein